MSDMPLVSIIIPVYNGSNYVGEAIESALAQTYPNIEIIVVNDGSNDNGQTESVVLSYRDKIRYFSKPNGGVSSALNFGISVMSGVYFSWLSHDDKYNETKIETQVNLLRKYGDRRVIALCEARFIDCNSELLTHQCKDRFAKEEEYIEWSCALIDLFKRGTFSGCGFLICKQYLDECGFFDEKLRFCQDTLMWAKLLLSGCSIVYSRNIGVLSRVHTNQQTHKSRHLLAHDSAKIAEYIVPDMVKTEQNLALYYFARRNIVQGNSEAARICMEAGKTTGIQNLKLFMFSGFAKIRPVIRKVYYAIFRRIEIPR